MMSDYHTFWTHLCPWKGTKFQKFSGNFQPGQHWRIACVSQRSKYMALAMKQIV